MDKLLEETVILDYSNSLIQAVIDSRNWKDLDEVNRVKAIYGYVKDEIKFGYNISDDIPSSTVLSDGYGQCNTKATLLMALLRAVGIPNRLHGFTIDKKLQKGAISGIWYALSPANILHSWVEVLVKGDWYNLEGIILDQPYISALQRKFPGQQTTFCGFGVYTDNFKNPNVEWNLNDTYIQDKGINQDFGLFDSPDDFYKSHEQGLNAFQKWIFRNFVRHRMNKNVDEIRTNVARNS